jgi:hypothetical protein
MSFVRVQTRTNKYRVESVSSGTNPTVRVTDQGNHRCNNNNRRLSGRSAVSRLSSLVDRCRSALFVVEKCEHDRYVQLDVIAVNERHSTSRCVAHRVSTEFQMSLLTLDVAWPIVENEERLVNKANAFVYCDQRLHSLVLTRLTSKTKSTTSVASSSRSTNNNGSSSSTAVRSPDGAVAKKTFSKSKLEFDRVR